MRRAAVCLVLALILVGTPGCVSFDGSGEVHVRVLVTRDVGTEVLTDETTTLRQGASAMDALRRVAEVETRYGGGFVHAIDGLASRYPDEKLDWFYHVNTRLADVGAAERTLADGDLVLFDYRSWQRSTTLEHVLTGTADWPVNESSPAFHREAYEQRQDDAEEAAELYARANGSRLQVLDAAGDPARTLQAPWLLAHAVPGPGEEPDVLLVPSDDRARSLAERLPRVPPSGVGIVLTPNATVEVPAS